jgi:hypothetical protein
VSKVNLIDWYREHVAANVWMICRFGHKWVATVPQPQELKQRTFKKRQHRAFNCPRCRREKKIWPSKVHPEVDGVFEAVDRLSGDVYQMSAADLTKLWKEQYADDWRAALALAAILADKIGKARVG